MTNDNTTYRKKANAVFFAAVMVVSMLAVGFAAAPAAAVNSSGELQSSDVGSAVASNVVFDEEEASQTIRVEYDGTNITSSGSDLTFTVNSSEIDYSGASASVSVSGADEDNVTSSSASIDSDGDVAVTVATEDNADELVVTVVADEFNTENLDPGTVSVDLIGASNIGVDNTVSAVYDDNVATLDDGDRGFSGKEFQIINGSEFTTSSNTVGSEASIAGADRIDLYSVNDDREIGTLESELTVETSETGAAYAEVTTSGLETGEYAVVFEGTGGTLETGDSVTDRAGNNTLLFQVTEQSLTTEFDDDSVTDAESSEVNIDSNRAGYNLVISSDSLDYDQLESIFGGNSVPTVAEGDQPRFDQNADDDEIVVESNDPLSADFANVDIDPGTYEFTFSATDSSAEDTASIDVSEDNVDGSFSQGVYTQTAGDVVEMSVELEDTSSGYIQLGDEESGFVDILYVEDDDDDDEVTFEVNTRTLGTGTANFDQVYNTDDDIVESQIHGTISEPDESLEFVDEDGDSIGDFSDYLNELDLISSASDTGTDQLVRPLQATTYEVSLNGDNRFIVNADGESELEDELDLSTLDLTQPSVDNLQTWSAPSDAANEDEDLEDVLNAVTQTTDIAEDDRLVIQAEASGLYGHMVALDEDGFSALDDGFNPQTVQDLLDNEGEGVNLEVEANDASGNQQPTALDFGGANEDDIFVIADNAEGQLYIVVDTSSDDAFTRSLSTDAEFTAELEYETDDNDRFTFDTQGDFGGSTPAAYPYFQSGEDNTQTVTTDFSIVERDASFDNMNADSEVEVANSETATVTGTTNVAPGSDASVRIRSDEGVSPSFVETTDVEIAEDGSFSAEFDLSGQSVDDTATVSFRVGGSSITDEDAVLVEEVSGTGAAFTVSDLSPQEATATAGDSVTVSATVENTGDSEGTQTVALTLDGDELDTQEVTLGAGNSTSVEFTADTTGLEAGDYEHGIATDDDEATGTLTIEGDSSGDDSSGDDSSGDDSSGDDSSGDDSSGDDSSGDDSSGDSSGDSTDDGTPGFGALVALVALIAAALLATRRND